VRIRNPEAPQDSLWRFFVVWVLGVGLGGGLLTFSSIVDHSAWKEQSSESDERLFLRYVDQLTEVHHVLEDHPQSPRWLPWLVGYRDGGEVLEDIAMAYRGAKAGGFLPEAAGDEPSDRANLPQDHQGHPAFRRFLVLGIAQIIVILVAVPFAVAAMRRLFSRHTPQRRGIWVRWNPGVGLALAFWSLLLFQMAAAVTYEVVAQWAPVLAESPWAPATNNAIYLILQGGPVLACALFFLPKWRHFARVLGLGAPILFRPATWALGMGLFGMDMVLNIVLYEIEKLGGVTDTRDFLTVSLIDAPLPGLLSELFTAAIIAPVCEEILFRGFLFNSLRGRLGPWAAAILSSLIFGGLHYYSWFGMAAIALFGMFACWIFARTGSLWPGILLHAISNAFITMGTWYAYSEFPSPSP